MRVHFVNTGPNFPYAYYLGIMSAIHAFGDKVKLWLIEEPSSKYWDLLESKLEIVSYPHEIPEFPMLKGRDVHFTRVCLFDNCAWRILLEEGGTIMGLDSLTLKGFHDLLEQDKEMLVGIDSPTGNESFCMHGATCRVSSDIARAIYKDSCKALNGYCPDGVHAAIENGRLRFGGAGIIPFLNHALANVDKLSIAEFGLLSGYHHREKLHLDCRTIPLYATSKSRAFGAITEEAVARGSVELSKVVKAVLPESEWKPFAKERRLYTFHVPGLVHLPISERYMACAFTQKIVKLTKMLLSLGHKVFLYGAEGSDAPCTEFVPTHTLRDIRREWGEGDNRFEIGYDWKSKDFKHDFNAARTRATLKFYDICAAEINRRKRDDDFLLIMQGVYHKPVADKVGLWLTCEPGIGYRGSYARFRAFESAYLQNFTYGSENPGECINGDWYDRVIPNYFDAGDFPFQAEKEDYFFYIGRMIKRKGVHVAVKTIEAVGGRLILAGQGELSIKSPNCEFIGYVGPEQRAELMGKARAVFVPTLYLEAFGGVNVEAQLCGTPVLTTNFACFESSVIDGITGYRCNTLDDFVWAARNVHKLNPHVIRKHAERYLMDNVRWEYQRWFDDLYNLFESARDTNQLGWHRIREFVPEWRGGERE